ncbi:MAG TPA: hypothetical protein VH092_28850 [Urbifossiella sp.]|jgi:hypothetical protein|nr:hypothetical protein [Urbifossiella sp.]
MRLPRWLKKTLAGFGILVAVLVLIVFIARASFRRMGTKELERVVARLDAEDPGWRLDDVLAARAKAAPPPESNPAVVAQDVRKKFDPAWEAFRSTRDWGGGPVHNEYPGFWALAWYLQAGTATAEAREAARAGFLRPDIAAQPGGYVPLTVPDNPYSTLLPHAQQTREVFELLDIDARLAALEGRPDRGITAARAGLVATRALGDEPFLISQLVRMAGANVASQSGMQVLAWGEPKAGLAEFQAALRAEAEFPYIEVGLRGERAALDRVFDGLESGKIGARDLTGMMGSRDNPVVIGIGFELYKGFLPGDRAMSLKLFSEMMDAAKKPHHERKRAFADLKYPFADAAGFRYIITKLCLPASQKVAEVSVRTRAQLLTASAAVACERFRQARGRWPESLDEIPADILPPLPPDPYTGRPLQFRRMPDGVLVFALADDLQQNRNFDQRPDPDPLAGIGRGWKLWDPELRGVPGTAAEPPPAVPLPDVDENP